jgi:large subunit ribosomal protein L23
MALFDFLKSKKKKEKNEDLIRATSPKKEKKEKEETVKRDASLPRHTGDGVLIAPHVTERARIAAEIGKYTFRIQPTATKEQVKTAVHKMYGVRPTRVQIIKVHEKPRRRGLTEGVKKGYKKAVVALPHGSAIDIF